LDINWTKQEGYANRHAAMPSSLSNLRQSCPRDALPRAGARYDRRLNGAAPPLPWILIPRRNEAGRLSAGAGRHGRCLEPDSGDV
jgi:hypothetical protein